MAILSGSRGAGGEGTYLDRECKRDYEKMIAILRMKKMRAESLREAIFSYNNESQPSDALAAMVGELEFEIRGFDMTINRLIEQQESEK